MLRLEELEERYRAVLARAGSKATLIAVSKTQPAEAVEALYRLGQRDFGENYVQELAAKAAELQARCPDIRWHFIGHLQSNKAKALVPWVFAAHAIDSESLARELGKRWIASKRAGKLPIFLEVNIDAETSKSGVAPADAQALVAAVDAIAGLELQGLMCIPAPGPGARAAFARLRELELRCRPHTRGGLSMGMTQDFEDAIREGATHVRVGTAIFGERNH